METLGKAAGGRIVPTAAAEETARSIRLDDQG